jgi:hypothetical protein
MADTRIEAICAPTAFLSPAGARPWHARCDIATGAVVRHWRGHRRRISCARLFGSPYNSAGLSIPGLPLGFNQTVIVLDLGMMRLRTNAGRDRAARRAANAPRAAMTS